MSKYRTLDRVAFGPGAKLVLSDEQAHARRNALKGIGGKRYEAKVAVEFKAGEVIGLVDAPPKAWADKLEAVKGERDAATTSA